MSKKMETATKNETTDVPSFVSLKTLAQLLQVHRASVRRWLAVAGIRPIALSDGPKSALRYPRNEVMEWINSRPKVE